MRLSILLCGVSACVVTALTGGSASAQPAEGMLEEVVVTARKRDEALQSVPVAVTSLSAAQLERQSVVDVRGIAATTPGMVMEQNPRSSMALVASMRGQASRDAVITSDQSIGLYVDDVYLARSQGAVTSFFDLAQVQILRGVQGTLFGRNNTGGAILVSTAKPEYEVSGRLRGMLGNYNARTVEGMLNVPLVEDKLALRLGVNRVLRDGYMENAVGAPDGNSRDIWAVRAQLRVDPTENWEAFLRYSETTARQTPNTAVPTRPGLGFTPPADFYTAVAGANAIDKLRARDVSLNSTVDLGGGIAVKAIAAYHEQRVFTRSDSDGYPTPLLDVDLIEDQKQFTGELQLSGSTLEERVEWLLGAFYFDEEGESSSIVPAIGRVNIGYGQNSAIAGFGHVDVKVTERLSLGAGVRYTSEDRAVQSSTLASGVCGVDAAVRRSPNICFADGSATFDYWSWEANANFQVTDTILVYARAGEGQKAGGFNNITNSALLNPFNPETARDLEGGLKADWLDHRLRTNFAIYETKYEEIQRTRVVPGPGGSPVTRVDNAADATIRGLEAEIAAQPTSRLNLAASYAYTDAEYGSFLLSGVDVSGNKFQFTPKNTYSLSATYDQPVGELGVLSLHADWSWKDDIEFLVVNRAPLRQEAYGLLNARATLEFASRPGVKLAVFGTNLLDEEYNVNGVDLSSFGYDVLYRGEPTMYGVELIVPFGAAAR
jgi:iron complex outermembrane receptor protein